MSQTWMLTRINCTKEYPVEQWQWKITSILKKGDADRKSGDDYPARPCIAFEYDASKTGFFERLKYRVQVALQNVPGC